MKHNNSEAQFFSTITKLYGHQGTQWLRSLPDLVAHCAALWNLTDLVVGEHLSYNYIVMAQRTSDNTPVVLKYSFDDASFAQEQQALEIYHGNGCVRLLAADATHKALLLERLVPGRSLSSLFPQNDNQAIEDVVALMKQLHAVPLPRTKTVQAIHEWLATLYHAHKEVGVYHTKKACLLAEQLLATQKATVMLHGDLHQGNILASGSTWRAIDPKGVLGEREYEVGAFIRNPTQQLIEYEGAERLIAHRIARFALLLHSDPQRIQAWSYVQAVLAACWHSEDGQDIDDMMRMAELIDHL